jgi:hypothetical protein
VVIFTRWHVVVGRSRSFNPTTIIQRFGHGVDEGAHVLGRREVAGRRHAGRRLGRGRDVHGVTWVLVPALVLGVEQELAVLVQK